MLVTGLEISSVSNVMLWFMNSITFLYETITGYGGWHGLVIIAYAAKVGEYLWDA